MIKSQIEPALLAAPSDEIATRLLLVEDNPGDVRIVKETLASQDVVRYDLIVATRLGEALIRVNREPFDAVLLDLSLPDARGLDTLARMRRRAPLIPIVVMTGLSDEALAVRALNEGAQDYLIKGENDAPALARRIRFAIERSRGLSNRGPRESPLKKCTTVGLLGSKGGVGASTLACYLAMAMQSRNEEPLLLADFDFESGILDFLMEIEASFTLNDALKNADRLDDDLWEAMVHEKLPNLDMISSPFGGITEDEETAERLQNVISYARSKYRWVVTDLGSGFHRGLQSLMEEIDETYIVTTLELPALRQARLMIQELKRLGRDPDFLRLVINELPAQSPYTSQQLGEMLGSPIWGTIPYVGKLRERQARSISLQGDGALGKAIGRMAGLIMGVQDEKPKRKWPFS